MSNKTDKVDVPDGAIPESGASTEPENKPDTKKQAQPAQKMAPATKPAKCGFCVYLGPSIRAVIQHGAILSTTKDEALKSHAAVIEKFPLVASMFIPGDEISKGRANLEKPGTLLYENYKQLAKIIT
jgi:hypothetical protein